MRAGLVSITFRSLPALQVLDLAARAGLASMEWGGDAHVPHGDLKTAREVGAATRDRGLEVEAYGSYYRLGESETEGLAFGAVVETAAALGAPVIRIWPGRRGSAEADEAYRCAIVKDALRCAETARAAGLAIAYECHANSLTDSVASLRDLLRATEHPAVFTLWQPPNGRSLEECQESLSAALPRLAHVHVFHWWPDHATRRPIAEGAERWRRYVETIRLAGQSPGFLLEFVPGDDPAILACEAETLKSWLVTEGR